MLVACIAQSKYRNPIAATQALFATIVPVYDDTNTLDRIATPVDVSAWDLVAIRGSEGLSAPVYCEGEYYRATTLEELREVVKKLEGQLSE